jgi:hypothetical protein
MQPNPFATVETICGPAREINGLRIVAPVKGRGLQRTLITRAENPDGFATLRRAVLSALLDARSGRDPWPQLSVEERDFLARAGLFVDSAEMPGQVSFDERNLPSVHRDADLEGTASAELRDSGIVVLPAVVSGSALDEMRRYYRALVAEGFVRFGGEGGEADRWILHDDPLSRAVHQRLASPVSAIAACAMKPTSSYLIVYLPGATLDRHRDRAHCAITVVLQVDFDPEPIGPTPWTLHFERGDARSSASLALGDAVVFRGHEIVHYRDSFTCGRSSTNLAFCFVPDTQSSNRLPNSGSPPREA